MATGIPYCDETWNVVAGCTRCSPACENCWAIGTTHRLAQNPALGVGEANPYAGLVIERDGRLDWTGRVRLRGDLLEDPLHWRNSRVVFVCSQADLFHPSVPDQFIDAVFKVMWRAPQHTFLLLTKRWRRLRQYMGCWWERAVHVGRANTRGWASAGATECIPWELLYKRVEQGAIAAWPLANVWAGVTVWDQETANVTLPILNHVFAAHKWLSIEPTLGPTDVCPTSYCERPKNVLCPSPCDPCGEACGYSIRPDWVVFGCESGPNARPCEWDWARQVRDACQEADIPFYLKQLPGPDGRLIHAPELDGRQWLQTPWAKDDAPC